MLFGRVCYMCDTAGTAPEACKWRRCCHLHSHFQGSSQSGLKYVNCTEQSHSMQEYIQPHSTMMWLKCSLCTILYVGSEIFLTILCLCLFQSLPQMERRLVYNTMDYFLSDHVEGTDVRTYRGRQKINCSHRHTIHTHYHKCGNFHFQK